MPTLPEPIVPIFNAFASLFGPHVFERAKLLIVGAVLTPGSRTVAAVLRTLGLADDPKFQNFHRVLSRNVWSARQAAGILLRLIVNIFVPKDDVVIAGDETLERRRGAKIKAKAVWHDPVRSSRNINVFSHGLRWLVFAVLAPIPWAGRVWALPFFTALLTSEKHDHQQERHHKPLSIWTIQMLTHVRRWLPGRKIVFVGDGSYSVLDLLAWCRKHGVAMVTRLRMDAALYHPPAPQPGQRGPKPKVGARKPSPATVLNDPATQWDQTLIADWYGGKPRTVETCTRTALWKSRGSPAVAIRYVLVRPKTVEAGSSDDQGQDQDQIAGAGGQSPDQISKRQDKFDIQDKFDPICLICTDQEVPVEWIISRFVSRWQIENTFRESRAHVGVETQRQWSDQAIGRTTPTLFGLYSLITLMAHRLIESTGDCIIRKAAWYAKEKATFSDALALVRRHLWQGRIQALFGGADYFCTSVSEQDMQKKQPEVIRLLTETLAYA